MNTSEVTYQRAGQTLRAYAAWPEGGGRLPGLVIVPDVRGLGEHYRDVARRSARVPRRCCGGDPRNHAGRWRAGDGGVGEPRRSAA